MIAVFGWVRSQKPRKTKYSSCYSHIVNLLRKQVFISFPIFTITPDRAGWISHAVSTSPKPRL